MKKDLVVLVSDRNMEYAIKGLLLRTHSLGIRQIKTDCYTHPEHDPGRLLRGHDFLRPFVNKYTHALVILDFEGCGQEQSPRDFLESQVEHLLMGSGWGNRAAAIIINPELEIWVWSNSQQVDQILGWSGRNPDLRTWLIMEGFAGARLTKPNQPKKAFEQALRIAGKARSSSIFYQLAGVVGLESCIDPAFNKLKTLLKTWFPLDKDYSMSCDRIDNE